MAGQPQDPAPSFQPAGQDQTQVRPAWQQPSYTPPAGSQHDTVFTQPGQSGPQAQQAQPQPQPPQPGQGQGQGYPAPSYAPPGQGYASQGYAAPGQQGQSAAPPQWNAYAGATPAAQPPKQRADSKGFLASLFDFSFTSFVTPKIVRVIYILLTLWTALWGLIFLIIAFKYGGMAGGIFTLIIVEPIYVLLTLGVYRVILEAFVVIFRLYEETKIIREQGERVSEA
jgi:hypothetical protein